MEIEYNNLNDDWINNFEKTDKLYQDFYKDDLYYTNLHIIYVNRENEIDKIKQESFLMSSPNYISREEVLGILKKNTFDNESQKQYTLLSILRYNITLDIEDIKPFLKDDKSPNFLNTIKNIDAISFEKSINMFHDLNDLIFVFYEKSSEIKSSNTHNITKKIYLRSSQSHRKTIKKRYKD
jgi:hypothetical protein